MKVNLNQKTASVAAAAAAAALMAEGQSIQPDEPKEIVLRPAPNPGTYSLPNRPDASGLSRDVRKKIARAKQRTIQANHSERMSV